MHSRNEPTVPANEDLVGTHSFQDASPSACVGKRGRGRSERALSRASVLLQKNTTKLHKNELSIAERQINKCL